MNAINRRTMLLMTAAAALPGAAAAAEYPVGPIRIIVPYAAGGAGDISMRALQPALERELGQALVIESRPGGGGTIGAQDVAKAAPDGYTLLCGATNNFVINPFMFPKIRFDPFASLALITKVTDVPSVMFSSLSVPAKTLGEFIAYAKANPGRLNYASPSVGTTPHLAVERLKQLTGIDLVHVPYQGAPPAMQALLEDQVQLYLVGWGVGRSYVEAGKINALAVASARPVPGIPLPTAIESGVPDYVASNWWGLAGPKATPQPIINRLYRAVTVALADPAVQAGLDKIGFLGVGNSPQAFIDDAQLEAKVWSETISRGHLAVE
jgi:tripartite-type tricarboxylate transporter receptor subunit TctC